MWWLWWLWWLLRLLRLRELLWLWELLPPALLLPAFRPAHHECVLQALLLCCPILLASAWL